MNISKKVLRFAGRDIILCGEQPFYRSSGRNSGKPGEWLPFDGIGVMLGLWFVKDRYLVEKYDPLYRYGTAELKKISEELGEMIIPEGKISSPFEVNEFLNTKDSKYFNSSWGDWFKKSWKDGDFDKYKK